MTNVALIGLGMVAGTFVDALERLSDTITVRGVYARNPDRRRKFMTDFAEKLPADCVSYGSVDEIAKDGAVDFVILATPPNARKEIVKTLAGAGKPILMEKPVERNWDAAKELCDTCEDKGVSLGIVLQHRMRPAAQKLTGLIASGELGKLHAVEVRSAWWRPQSYYDEPGRGTYERDGGGVLISQAIHTLDLMLSLAGPVSEVTAMTSTTGLHKMETEDFVAAGLVFENGALGSLFASTASFPGRPESINLHFEKASVELVSNLLTLDWPDGRRETFGAVAATGAGANPMAFSSDWHMAIIEDFDVSLKNGQPPIVPGRAALSVHGLIEALESSGRLGQKMKLVNGRIVN